MANAGSRSVTTVANAEAAKNRNSGFALPLRCPLANSNDTVSARWVLCLSGDAYRLARFPTFPYTEVPMKTKKLLMFTASLVSMAMGGPALTPRHFLGCTNPLCQVSCGSSAQCEANPEC